MNNETSTIFVIKLLNSVYFTYRTELNCCQHHFHYFCSCKFRRDFSSSSEAKIFADFEVALRKHSQWWTGSFAKHPLVPSNETAELFHHFVTELIAAVGVVAAQKWDILVDGSLIYYTNRVTRVHFLSVKGNMKKKLLMKHKFRFRLLSIWSCFFAEFQ